MAPSWATYNLLKDTSLLIEWQDFQSLWESFIIEAAVKTTIKGDEVIQDKLLKVYPVGPWGHQLKAIALGHSDELVKNRQVAELCWKVFSIVRYGNASAAGEAPWADENAKVWQDDCSCPAKCNKSRVPKQLAGAVSIGKGKHSYPGVIFAKQKWERLGVQYDQPVKLSLHRLACWLAVGQPGSKLSYATHKCGKRECLRLGCLRWGNAKTNEADMHDLVEGLGRMKIGRQPKG